jgi:hypothetical protein
MPDNVFSGEEEYTVGVALEPRYTDMVDNLSLASDLLDGIMETSSAIESIVQDTAAAVRSLTRDTEVLASVNERVRATWQAINSNQPDVYTDQIAAAQQLLDTVRQINDVSSGIASPPPVIPGIDPGVAGVGGGGGYMPAGGGGGDPAQSMMPGGAMSGSYQQYMYGPGGAYWYQNQGQAQEERAQGQQRQRPQTVEVAQMIVRQQTVQQMVGAGAFGVPVSPSMPAGPGAPPRPDAPEGQGGGFTAAPGVPAGMTWDERTSQYVPISSVGAGGGGPLHQDAARARRAHQSGVGNVFQNAMRGYIMRAVSRVQGSGPLGAAIGGRVMGAIERTGMFAGGRAATVGGLTGGAVGGAVGDMSAATALGIVALPLMVGYEAWNVYSTLTGIGAQYSQLTGTTPGTGASVSQGLGYEVRARLMGLSPFLTTDQSRQIIQATLQQGYTGRVADSIIGYIADNVKTGILDIGDSLAAFDQSVNLAGGNLTGLRNELETIRFTAAGTQASMQEMGKGFVGQVGRATQAGLIGQAPTQLAGIDVQMFAGSRSKAVQNIRPDWSNRNYINFLATTLGVRNLAAAPFAISQIANRPGGIGRIEAAQNANWLVAIASGGGQLQEWASRAGNGERLNLTAQQVYAAAPEAFDNGIISSQLVNYAGLDAQTAANTGAVIQAVTDVLNGVSGPAAGVQQQQRALGVRGGVDLDKLQAQGVLPAGTKYRESDWTRYVPFSTSWFGDMGGYARSFGGMFESGGGKSLRSVGSEYADWATGNNRAIPVIESLLKSKQAQYAFVRDPKTGTMWSLLSFIRSHPGASNLLSNGLAQIELAPESMRGAIDVMGIDHFVSQVAGAGASGTDRLAQSGIGKALNAGDWRSLSQQTGLPAEVQSPQGFIDLVPDIKKYFRMWFPGNPSRPQRNIGSQSGYGG